VNVQDRIQKLESLLGRIRTNGARARVRSHAGAAEARPAATPNDVVAKPQPKLDDVIDAFEDAPAAAPSFHAPVVSLDPPLASERPEPPPEIDVAPAEIEELDMMDADIVELGEEATAMNAAPADDAPLESFDEPMPESAPRAASPAYDEEPPVKTPPPESGRQATVASWDEPTAADEDFGDDAGLEADLSGVQMSDRAVAVGPTMEQLGETVELEGADAPAAVLELDAPHAAGDRDVPDELELPLPEQSFPGAYDGALSPPAEASADLERHAAPEARSVDLAEEARNFSVVHDVPVADAIVAPPVASLSPNSLVDVSAQTVRASRPILVQRPDVESAHAAEVIVDKPQKTPETFAELLDASLELDV
jgi:hypothetical protein